MYPKRKEFTIMEKIYGYARISRRSQNIERQIRNILAAYPDARIFQEAYTGTKIVGRTEFNKMLRIVKPGDTIVFDSVSRMSRNSEDGIALYFKLFDNGINLVFLKERYINTDIYNENLKDKITLTGTDEDEIFIGLNNYFRRLAKRQIQIAFDQSQKEVDDLRQRTREGIETAKMNGKQIGQKTGAKLHIKKKEPKKAEIKKYCRDFGNGSLNDKETIKQIGISRNTYYKYKKEILQEISEHTIIEF